MSYKNSSWLFIRIETLRQEGGKTVTKSERQNWINSIENSAAVVSSELGSAVVESVFRRFGVNCVEDASDSILPDIFSEMYAYEADLK